VDAKGTIYLPRGWCGEPYLAISKDEGDTWTRIKVADKPLPYDPANGAWANDSGAAVDAQGNLYYTWVADDYHPYLTISRDRGKTWTKPVDILPPGVIRTQNPSIDVGSPGKIAIAFLGSQQQASAPGAQVTWSGYITESADALAANPTFYAAPVDDPNGNPLWKGECGSSIRCGNMGDFYEVRIGPDGLPRAAFVNSCPGGECTAFGVTAPRGEAVMGQLVGGPALGPPPAYGAATVPRLSRAASRSSGLLPEAAAGPARRGRRPTAPSICVTHHEAVSRSRSAPAGAPAARSLAGAATQCAR
jgi:hypothetical protein